MPVAVATGEIALGRRAVWLPLPDMPPPLVAGRDGLCVVLEGRLHNREELRRRVCDGDGANGGAGLGDAALVLQAYLVLGKDLPRALRGTFSLGIWDARDDSLLLVRDPVGVYPCFYTFKDGKASISTDLSILARHPCVAARVNRLALAERLCRGRHEVEGTCYEGLLRLPPGHALVDRPGGRAVSQYWNPVEPGSPVQWVSPAEAGSVLEVLGAAVGRCLEYGPAGVFLSGGLDSITVAMEAADHSRRLGLLPPVALSMATPEAPWEEEVRRGVAFELGLPRIVLDGDEGAGSSGILQPALDLAAGWPFPLQNPWLPRLHALGEAAAGRGCRVILTGVGGDEWLTVTPRIASDLIRTADLRGLYRLWRATERSYDIGHIALIRVILWDCGLRPLAAGWLRRRLQAAAPSVLRARWRRKVRQSTPRWVAPDPDLRREMDARAEMRMASREVVTEDFYLHHLWLGMSALQITEMEEFFESGRRIGLPIRHPFWDAEVAGWLGRMPPDLLIAGMRQKGLVREALAARFPLLGLDRQKKVVGDTVFEDIMLNEGRRAWGAMGGVPALASLGIVDGRGVEAEVTAILSGRDQVRATRIWDVLSVEAWVRGHV